MTEEEGIAIVKPLADLCMGRGWLWRWNTELRDTHWHSSIAVWAVVDSRRVVKARYGSSRLATIETAEADVLERAMRCSLDRIEAADEEERHLREYRERGCVNPP